MDARKPVYLQIQDLRDMWREVWWSMAGGTKSEYDKIKATEVLEYWKLFDLWRDRVNRERELYQQKQNQHNNGK